MPAAPSAINWTGCSAVLIRTTGSRCLEIGAGVREIRVRDRAGAFRVIYLATLADAIYVLHAFQKKSQQTMRRDVDCAAERLRQLKRRP
jgi:phage-related protein